MSFAGKKQILRYIGLLLTAVMTFALIGTSVLEIHKGNQSALNNSNVLSVGSAMKTTKVANSIKGGIRGIDVSKYQGEINWKKVSGSDVDFAFIRASYGTTSDPMFVTNAKNANKNGIKVGAYHFATFTDSKTMKKEAKFFISRLKKVDITYPVVLDLEGASHKKIKKSTLTKLANDFMKLVEAEGYTVMLYSYNNFIRDHLNVKSLNYDLWVANYIERPTSITHKVWQHTSSGRVSGIKGDVDINIAYEDLSTGRKRSSSSGGTKTAVKKKVTVDKTISNSIKATLNDRYNSGLSVSGINMTEMNIAILKGLQTEVNEQWDLSFEVDGTRTSRVVHYISSVKFTSSTKGNITYLLQAKLFYKGLYPYELSGKFDSNTVTAIKAFQAENGLKTTGTFDKATLEMLL